MRIMMFVLAAGLAVGCKDKAKPMPGDKPIAAAGSDASPAPADASPTQGSVLVLPKLESGEIGKPPHKTTKPVDKATYEKLSKLTYVGFKQEIRAASEHLLDMRYVTEEKPRLAVVVKMWHCPAGDELETAPEESKCHPLKLDEWKAKADGIKAALKGGLAESPDTKIEFEELDVGGEQKAIVQYQLGYTVGAERQGEGGYTNTYIIWWNDGINQLRVSAEYKDDPTATLQDMLNLAPKEDLATIARAFFDVFSHSWE